MKPSLQEVIVVEGRDDTTAVKAAVEAEVLETGGFGVRAPKTLEAIRFAQERVGVIVLTDPDFAGETIRRTIERAVPGVKHAFIRKEEGQKAGRVGVEYASPEAIRLALSMAKPRQAPDTPTFTPADLLAHQLTGHPQATLRRRWLGQQLRIGEGNAKSFLSKLNHYGVTPEEFAQALQHMPDFSNSP